MKDILNDIEVCFVQNDAIVYPTHENDFSPSEVYPEYPFKDSVSDKPNYVYAAVRDLLHILQLDNEHYGTDKWNPLGDFINPGDNVLIKPNWVMHYNKDKNGGMDCLVTNPSIIRAVLDYVYIATHGQGSVTVGDAPMAECNFKELHEKMHYNLVWNFYENHSVDITVKDFRSSILLNGHDGQRFAQTNPDTGVVVNLGAESKFEELSDKQIDNFVMVLGSYPDNIKNYHSRGEHKYLISKDVINSDVIISLPKIKAHRKAGLTACSKNFVGTCQIKDCLPHSIYGSVEHGGCEYPKSNLFTFFFSKLKKWQFKNSVNNKVTRNLRGNLALLSKKISPDNIGHWDGAWYGNDAVWRFVYDLNNVIRYADKEGRVQQKQQRIIFNLGDAIVAGQRNGPLSPLPKELHAIVGGFNGIAIDYFMTQIMGFDPSKINYIPAMLKNQQIDVDKIKIIDNKGAAYTIKSFPYQDDWCFIPPDGWKGHLEKR